jgi:oxygen-independent coproporphyrinogen-3 oxidase
MLLQQVDDALQLFRLAGGGAPLAIDALYLHIPFCFHKCHYCDFYSIVDDRDRQTQFVDRMIGEIAALAPLVASPISTLFVGGGTPTLLRPDLWQRLLPELHSRFNLTRLTEFTVEANPETLTPELLAILTAGGVNRISIGCQSFNPIHLKTLERWHDPASVTRAVGLARSAGLTNLNLDLIFAIPGQTLPQWLDDLDRALALEPDHLSCYSLMYEPNTALTKKLQLGLLTECDESLEAAMYEATVDRLAAAGFQHYEISNWARRARPGSCPGSSAADGAPASAPRRCHHNMLYWLNGNYLAIGPSASGHVAGYRWKNIPHLGRYLATAGPSPVQDVEKLDDQASIGEQIMLRLRLIEGVERHWLEPRLNESRRRAIDEQHQLGLLHITDTHIRLTQRGLLLADEVIAQLL